MTVKDEGPHPFDIHVGARVRQQRKLLGMSQDDLAKALGITFQQVQKYEHGTNRISMSRMLDISEAFGVDFDFFLEGYPLSTKKGPKAAPINLSDTWVADIAQLAQDVKGTQKRRQVREFIKLMATVK